MKPIYNKMNEKTVWLFHKANWIDINFSIRTTMTKTTLNKRNVTEDEIDNYVGTLTITITSVIAKKVPTKSIKRNSMGIPIENKGTNTSETTPEATLAKYKSTAVQD